MLLLSAKTAAMAMSDYSPISDVTILGICLLIFVMLTQTSVRNKKQLRLAVLMLFFTALACYSNMINMVMLAKEDPPVMMIYFMRTVRHISLSAILFTYTCYQEEPLWIPDDMRKRMYITSLSLQILTTGVDIALSAAQTGYHIHSDGTMTNGTNVYKYLFVFYLAVIFYRTIRFRKRVIRKVFWCILFSNVMCVVMMAAQGRHHQTSFTSVAFFMPVLCLIYMFHSNPYDTDTGALSEKFFYENLNTAIEKKKTMIIFSCQITDFFKILKESKMMQHEYRSFFQQNFQWGTAYRFTSDRLVYVFQKKNSEAQNDLLENMLNDFRNNHQKFGIDYKIIITETRPELTSAQDYMKLIMFAEKKIDTNSFYQIEDDDIKSFYTMNSILKQLEDINHKKDLNDPRVLVYCQPVYNIVTGAYDTAEALMRLELDGMGTVFPDKFIPIAEENGLIHTLSLIILNKTCAAIHDLIKDGFHVDRISVNFSTLDLRYETFCEEVQQIAADNRIPLSKIAIEITESRNDSDFNIMVTKVKQLQKLGTKFYLDDFGTGYSNFERIMEIPFDIIKFDRSMLIESGKSDHSFYMVCTFARMFNTLNYSVLFEGVENDADEINCKNMNAKYLQGYKYSKPIPINDLRSFFSRINHKSSTVYKSEAGDNTESEPSTASEETQE